MPYSLKGRRTVVVSSVREHVVVTHVLSYVDWDFRLEYNSQRSH